MTLYSYRSRFPIYRVSCVLFSIYHIINLQYTRDIAGKFTVGDSLLFVRACIMCTTKLKIKWQKASQIPKVRRDTQTDTRAQLQRFQIGKSSNKDFNDPLQLRQLHLESRTELRTAHILCLASLQHLNQNMLVLARAKYVHLSVSLCSVLFSLPLQSRGLSNLI